MDRRSFVLSIFGGLAAASVGGAAFAKTVAGSAIAAKPDLAPALAAAGELDAATRAGLDKADAEFNQLVVRRRPRYHRPVVVRRRVIVRRPRRVVVVGAQQVESALDQLPDAVVAPGIGLA